jgi:acyl-CoA synthetase (AMP-forming)/AMP-acid ligase II
MLVIGDIIRNNAAQYPAKVGLIHESQRFTWKETEERVNRCAQALKRLGVKKGDGVGIIAKNSHCWIEAALAMAKLGVRMVPLNIRLEAGELRYIINDAEVGFLLVGAEKAETIAGLLSELSLVRGVMGIDGAHGFEHDYENWLARCPPEDPGTVVKPDDIAMVVYTSGTTGRPKGAMLTHRQLTAAALCEGYEYRLIPSHITMTFIPLFFIGGWAATCLPYLVRGCTQHVLSFDAGRVLRLFEQERINCTLMVPTMINMLLNHPEVERYDYSSLRCIPFAGSAMPVEHWKRAARVFGDVFVSMYGFTEGCATVAILQPEDVHPSIDGGPSDRRMASCGRAMVQTSIRLIDEDGGQIPIGSDRIGEICVKGPTIFKGYWKNSSATRAVLEGGWFKTGDLARRDDDGFLYIVDRKKDVIISGGINIYPREIEEVIYTHPAVLECSVIGVPDDKWGETVKAVIRLKPGLQVGPTEIIDLCRQQLASYKKPTSVDIVDDLPRTASGKIIRRKLREWYWPDPNR